MEQFIEDHATVKSSRPPLGIEAFSVNGSVSKHDKQGILDENTKLRQLIARGILAQDNILADKDMINVALKAMADNDKVVIAQARLAVDEESNNASKDLVAAIVSEVIGRPLSTPSVNPEIRRDMDIELPNASREINDDELVVGTEQLSEAEVLEQLNGSSE